MAEDTARAVGAGSNEPIVIQGKSCKIRPLTIRELAEVERDCLRLYRTSYLSTYSENLNLLPKALRSEMMEKKMEEAARWDVSDLPPKPGHDPAKVRLTPALRTYLESDLGLLAVDDDEKKACRIASIVLDQGLMDKATYKKLTGENPRTTPINYAQWWISSTFDGQIAMITACLSPCGVTQDQIIEEMRDNPTVAIRLSSEIEVLSTPQVGNG